MKCDTLVVKRYIKSISRYENYEIEQAKRKFDVKCKNCGRTNRIINKYNRIPCKHCGNYVFLTPEDEFKFKLKRAMK